MKGDPTHALEPRDERACAALAEELVQHGVTGRSIAVVLGSGLGSFVERLGERRTIQGSALEHLPRPRVKGHAGEIVLGECRGVPLIVQSGRVHLYEGHPAAEVTRFVRALARIGVQGILLTNASGGLDPAWPSGTWMRLTDHLNLQGAASPWRHRDNGTSPYDEDLGTELDQAARELRLPLERGVYAGMLGPSYETPAEIRALRNLGASAVGMSTIAEACAAREAGLRVVALACIANPAAGLTRDRLRHEDVLHAMQRSAERLTRLLERALPVWHARLARPN